MSVKLTKDQITHIITKALELETHRKVTSIKFNVTEGWRGDQLDPGETANLNNIEVTLGDTIVNQYAGMDH